MSKRQQRGPGRPRKVPTLDELASGAYALKSLRAILIARYNVISNLRRDGITWEVLAASISYEYGREWSPSNLKETWRRVCKSKAQDVSGLPKQGHSLASDDADTRTIPAEQTPDTQREKQQARHDLHQQQSEGMGRRKRFGEGLGNNGLIEIT